MWKTFIKKESKCLYDQNDYFLFTLFFLFKALIWNKYIVNPTAWDALKGEASHPGIMEEIDGDNHMAILKPKDSFYIYLVSKGFWGWMINNEIAIPNERSSEPFTAQIKSLKLKGKDDLDIILILSRDKEIDYFTAYDENGEEYRYSRTVNREKSTYLFFTYREEKLPNNLIYEAYLANDKLLYKE